MCQVTLRERFSREKGRDGVFAETAEASGTMAVKELRAKVKVMTTTAMEQAAENPQVEEVVDSRAAARGLKDGEGEKERNASAADQMREEIEQIRTEVDLREHARQQGCVPPRRIPRTPHPSSPLPHPPLL